MNEVNGVSVLHITIYPRLSICTMHMRDRDGEATVFIDRAICV